MNAEITKERVLEAASKCPQAKETLKTLFPVFFSDPEDILNGCRTYELALSKGIENGKKEALVWYEVPDNEITLSKLFKWKFGKSKDGKGFDILIPERR